MQVALSRFLAVFFVFLLFHPSTRSQTLKQRIETAYSTFEADPQLKYATSSLTVLNTLTGEVIFSSNPNTGLAPASTLKTITSATAFHILGPDFKYETSLGYSGKITANGILQGDLIITGGGDPTLGSPRYPETTEHAILYNWVESIKRAGIKKIEGRILTDDGLFGTETLPVGWIWQDMGNYFGAGASSLSWRENQFDLIFKAGNTVGDPAMLLHTIPSMPSLTLINEVRTGPAGSGDKVYAFSSPYSTLVYLRGTYGIDLKKNISASVPDPALDAANRLLDTLTKCGIQARSATTTRISNLHLTPQESGIKNQGSRLIDTHNSPNLQKMIYLFNQKSINLYGEHFIKTLAWKQNKPATTLNGSDIIKDFWNKKLGIDKNAMNIIDGSGLSPGTRVTTLAMAQILSSAKAEPWFNSYFESFPMYNNMKMKSGSINDVLAYAGYQTNSTGVPLAFSFIVNNYNGSTSSVRQKMFNVLNALK